MANPENKQIPYESTQKDIRDAIESVATAIGGIAIPSADHVSYDNSVSGLSATDVQNAIDELASEKVDKEVGKGLSTNDYTTAEKTKLAGIEAGAEVNPTSSAKTATESFETVNGGLLSKCMIDLVPVQSGSGDPYPAGGGKNKFNIDGFSDTQRTVVASVNNGVLHLQGTVTAGGNARFALPTTQSIPTGSVTLSVSGSNENIRVIAQGDNGFTYTSQYGNFTKTFTITDTVTLSYFYVDVTDGTTVNADVKIQIESGSTATTFAPYSNVRPINGHTEVDLQRDGKNLFDPSTATVGTKYSVSGDVFTVLNATGAIAISQYTFLANTTYTINITMKSGTVKPCIIIRNPNSSTEGQKTNYANTSQPLTFSFTQDTTWNILLQATGSGSVISVDDTFVIQLEKGNQATSYEPYKGNLYQAPIGSTVYGGYDEIVSGSGKSAYGIADFGDLTWYYDSANTRFRGEMPSNYKQPTGASDRYQYLYCSCYKPDDSPVTGSHVNNTIGGFQGTTSVWVNDSAYTDAGQFKTARTGQKIAYLLSTPTDITTIPQQIETLSGQNNLSTPLSGQSIETNGVEYKELFTFADVKEYVDKKIPDAPTTDGTYTLQAVVSGGVPTYSWV